MSYYTLGSAAAKILNGHITKETIDQESAACAWCQEPRMNRQCWHVDAEILLNHGLTAHPAEAAPHAEPSAGSLW